LHGAEYVNLGDSESLTFGDGVGDIQFSLEAWIKMDSTAFFPIMGKGAWNVSAEWNLKVESGTLYFIIYDESVASTQEYAYYAGLSADTWYHIVGTYDGRGGTSANAGMSLYVNGSGVTESLGDAGTYVAMENLGADAYIGRFETLYSKGNIDEVRVYHKELSATEVLTNYNNGKSAHS
jgi:hypothetical protein